MFLFLAECNSLFLVAHNREIVLFFLTLNFKNSLAIAQREVCHI